jgi:hypothetical protein
VEELRAGAPAEARDRGDYILSYMHRQFLRSYSARQSRLDTLLSNGRYNCVSSAVLYLILARSQGLDVRGVATADHAFVTLVRGDEAWDVETTNLYGFDPGNRREFQDQFGKLTGFAYVPARNYRNRIELSPLELISLIIHNHIADLERQGRYDLAVPLALNRASLLAERENPVVSSFFADPRQDLRDRLLNYGASLLNAGKEEEGLRWALYAGPAFSAADGHNDPRWQNYLNMLVSNRVAKFGRARQFTAARDFLAEWESWVDPAENRRLEAMVDNWLVTDFHNRFAAAFNRRDYSLAQGILDQALGEFPGDRRLLSDQNSLERALAPR